MCVCVCVCVCVTVYFYATVYLSQRKRLQYHQNWKLGDPQNQSTLDHDGRQNFLTLQGIERWQLYQLFCLALLVYIVCTSVHNCLQLCNVPQVRQDGQSTYKSNMKARSCNQCCLAKAIIITYYDCVLLSLGIQDVKRMLLLSSEAYPALQYFLHIIL